MPTNDCTITTAQGVLCMTIFHFYEPTISHGGYMLRTSDDIRHSLLPTYSASLFFLNTFERHICFATFFLVFRYDILWGDCWSRNVIRRTVRTKQRVSTLAFLDLFFFFCSFMV